MSPSTPGQPTRNSRLAAFAGPILVAGLALATLTLRAAGARAAGIGDPAPDFTAENVLDTAPDVFQLSQYAGQIVVLSFFAHW